MKNFTMRTSLLGLFSVSAALSVGCAAGSTDNSADPVGATEQPGIAAVGTPIINGCNVSQLFNVTSAQDLGFIAVQAANAQNLTLQLFSLDQQGNSTALNQSAQATDAQMQALLNQSAQASSSLLNSQQASNNTAANSSIVNSQSANANTTASASQNAFLNDTASTTVSHTGNVSNSAFANNANNAFSNQSNSAAAQNANNAFANQASSASANQNANSILNNSVGSSTFGIGGIGNGFGIAVVSPSLSSTFFQNLVAAQNAAQAAMNQSQIASGSDSQTAAQNQSAIAAGSNNSASSGNQSSWNTVDTVTTQHDMNSGSSMNSATSTNSAASNSLVQNANALNDSSASNLTQAANQASLFSNAANSAQNSANSSALQSLSFSNLLNQQLQNVQLLVSFNVAAQNSTANIFSGSNSNVFSNSIFSAPILSGCGGAAVVTPIVADP